MDLFSIELFALLFFTLLCVAATLYSAQAKVRGILSRFPEPPEIENTTLNLLERELLIKIKEYKRLPPAQQKIKRDDLVQLKHKCEKTKNQTEPEYKAYHFAAQGWIQAWKDLDGEFYSTSFLPRSLSSERIQTIKIYLKRYYTAKYRFELEHKKLSSRDRVWLKEGKQISSVVNVATGSTPTERAAQKQLPATKSSHNNGPFIVNTTQSEQESEQEEAVDALLLFLSDYQNPELEIEPLFEEFTKEQGANLQADQKELLDQAPNFSNRTYLDTKLDLTEVSRIERGDFSYSFFISVEFLGLQEIRNSLFYRSDFSNSKFQAVEDEIIIFNDCWFDGASFKGCFFSALTFVNCAFHSVDFTRAELDRVRFIHCHFQDCTGMQAKLSNCSISSLSLPIPANTPAGASLLPDLQQIKKQ